MIDGIHHLTFVVRSVERACTAWSALLGCEPIFETLLARRARSARFLVGTTWIVLVEPTDAEGAIAQHLAEHGEGLLLVSLGVADLDRAIVELQTHGIQPSAPERKGLQRWRVQDVAIEGFAATTLQLCEDREARDPGA